MVILIIIFRRSEKKRGKELFDIALNHHDANEYEKACYYYAVALNAGYNENICRERIITLWADHGPFKFEEQLDKAKASGGEGSHVILTKDINDIVKKSNASS
ncbi:MAG: hypothetical protein JSV21_06900 [Nitrospirota bacterium]|nr:MAG: hypothetical protein JSV21_06900 [Nitrospirota bacterium]